jgi:RNA polymerase sigma factor (sigma-70 family)
MEHSDRILIRRLVREDDAEAFSALVAQYADMVYGTCRRVLGNDALAADAVQETFFQLLKNARSIQGSVASWLHQVATRRAVDLVRKEASQRRREERYAADFVNDSNSWEGVEPLVDEALDELPEDVRELLILHYLKGQSTTEIATAKGVSQPTVSRHLSAALDSLRQKLRARDVVVGLTLLTGFMANTAQAAPEPLLQALGKMTLAKAAASGTGVVAGTAKWLSITGVKAALTTAAVVLVAGTGYVAVHHHAVKEGASAPAAASTATPATAHAEKAPSGAQDPRLTSAPTTAAVPGNTLGTNQDVAQFTRITNLSTSPQWIFGTGRAGGGAAGGAGGGVAGGAAGGVGGGMGNIQMQRGAGGFVGGGAMGTRVGGPPPYFGPRGMQQNMRGGTRMGMSFGGGVAGGIAGGGGGGSVAGGSGMTSFQTNFGFMRTMTFSNGMTWETQTDYSSGSGTPAPARGK